MPHDWLELERQMNEIWAILNEDTTLSDMTSDITVGSSDLKVVSDSLSDTESEQKVISDALSDTESEQKVVSDALSDLASDLTLVSDSLLTMATSSNLTVVSNALSDTESEQVVISDALSDVVSDLVVISDALSDTESEQIVLSNAISDLVFTSTPGGSDTYVQYNNGGVLGGDSTFTFNDTTKTVSATNLSLGGFLDVAEIAAPATPAADTLRLYVEDIQGFSFYKYLDSGGMKREVLRDSMILVYNNSGSQILANRVVYASGSFNNFPTVALAQSNSVSTMPAIGVTIENINDSAYGRIMQVGLLEDIDTSALSVGDILYVHDTVAGLVRITAPTTPALTQEIGTVLVDNASTGAIQIIARGLTGDEHGTAQNDFYIGDGTAGSKTLHFNAVTDASIIWDETKFDLTASPLTTTGAVTAGSLVLTTDLAVTHGGSGASTFTDHSILLGSGTAAFTALGAATNGQLPIGSTGADPVLASLTGKVLRFRHHKIFIPGQTQHSPV
jgi:hypothetical protein